MNPTRIPFLTLAACALALTASCGGGEESGDEPGVTVSAEAKAEAESYFTTTCVACHGEIGKGDGPGGAALDPKPKDFTNEEWQDSVTDQHIFDIIVGGGSAVGKAATMPPNPVLKSKDEVVHGLVQHVRSLRGK